MLDKSDDQQEKRKLISAIEAIEKLYNSSELNVGDNVTTVDIGFHTRVPLENGVQVFVPVWKITVDDERHYFVKDRKSTRLNSSHVATSYAVFCLKKKK